ncbi:MAG: PadR family transcriptional regulator [Clostridia bacterium]
MALQIGNNMLDMLVLAILRENDTYGYVLTQRVQSILDVSGSALYPVLRRLLQVGACATYDVPFGGRNRRYYSITTTGHELLRGYISDWNDYRDAVEQILKGGDGN